MHSLEIINCHFSNLSCRRLKIDNRAPLRAAHRLSIRRALWSRPVLQMRNNIFGIGLHPRTSLIALSKPRAAPDQSQCITVSIPFLTALIFGISPGSRICQPSWIRHPSCGRCHLNDSPHNERFSSHCLVHLEPLSLT